MKKRLFLVPGLIIFTLVPTAFAATESKVEIRTNTGNNVINGVQTNSSCKTRVVVNGKVIVDDSNCDSVNYSETSDEGGKVEVHVNSNNTTAKPNTSVNGATAPTVRPTVDIEPTIEKKKEEIKKEVLEAREEAEETRKSLLEQVGDSIQGIFARIGSLFTMFGN